MSNILNKHGVPYQTQNKNALALKLAANEKRRSKSLIKDIEDFVQHWVYRNKQDIQKWREAVRMAEAPQNRNKAHLYNLYRDIIIDSHLSSLMQTRSLKVMKSEFALVDSDGETNSDATELLNRPWFYDLMTRVSEAPFYGFTLIEFGDIIDGKIQNIHLLPHACVKEKKGIVVKNPFDEKGVDYTDSTINDYVLEIGRPGDIGLLMKAAPQVLWKKNAQAAWSEFTEIFGMPLRIGKTSSQDKDRRRMADALKNMGRAAYAVINEGDEIELVKSAGQQEGYKVYDNLIARTNSELSKLILGGTMLADDGSSRSQSEVHERVADDVVMADMQYMSFLFNFQLLPKLERIGYPVSGLRFKWIEKQELDLKDQWKMVHEALKLNQFEMDIKEISERFNLPITGLKQSSDNEPDSPSDEENSPSPEASESKKKGSEQLSLSAGIEYDLCSCSDHSLQLSAESYRGLKTAFNQLMKRVWDASTSSGTDRTNDFNYCNFYASELEKAATQGVDSLQLMDFDNPDWNLADKQTLSVLKRHIWAFSAANTQNEVLELNALAKKTETFGKFKEQALDKLPIASAHLRTEYTQMQLTSQNITRYKRHRFAADNEVKVWWEYQTVGDSRVRESHAALNGARFKYDDPIWDEIYPPNGWNCRCIVIPRDEENTSHEIQSGADAKERLQEIGEYDRMKKYGFDDNPAKTNKVFGDDTKGFYKKLLGSTRGKLNYEGYGLLPAKELMKQSRKKSPLKPVDDDYPTVWFDRRKDKSGNASVKDYEGRDIVVIEEKFLEHARRDYKGEDRLAIVQVIEIALQNPNEVWLYDNNDIWDYKYVLYYDGVGYAVVLNEVDGELVLKSWYQINDSFDAERRDILQRRKK